MTDNAWVSRIDHLVTDNAWVRRIDHLVTDNAWVRRIDHLVTDNECIRRLDHLMTDNAWIRMIFLCQQSQNTLDLLCSSHAPLSSAMCYTCYGGKNVNYDHLKATVL